MTKLNKIKKTAGGFTLIELLISLVIGGIILLAEGSLLSILLSNDTRSRQLESLEQTKYFLQTTFTESIKWAKTVEYDLGSETLTLTYETQPTIVFQKLNNKLLKDGQALTEKNITVNRFLVNDYSVDPAKLSSLRIEIVLANTQIGNYIDKSVVVVSQRNTIF
jgi:prepilin-type N-terminal cleavage/methylation domain-containing protein